MAELLQLLREANAMVFEWEAQRVAACGARSAKGFRDEPSLRRAASLAFSLCGTPEYLSEQGAPLVKSQALGRFSLCRTCTVFKALAHLS
jgi:hypothetical protein